VWRTEKIGGESGSGFAEWARTWRAAMAVKTFASAVGLRALVCLDEECMEQASGTPSKAKEP
jgi:hypothetical protein